MACAQIREKRLIIIWVVEGYINLHAHANGVMLHVIACWSISEVEHRGALAHDTGVIASLKHL